MTLNSGDVLVNRYRIVKLVGQGGFGAVYRAWDTSLGVPVALKENLDTSAEAQHQFEQEARLLAPLRHDNLPRVSDHFFISGQGQYLVMDFVEGKSLEALLAERGGPLPEAEALRWMTQVCDALEYLHTRTPPIIHRDIKPQNIIINADGRAVLVDFGISKAYDPALKTTKGARAVTPGYSPPEQYGMGTTDARSDVYALGATLYTLLTGSAPPESVALIAGGETLPPIRQTNPGVNPATEAAVAAAMTLAASQRLSGAGELRDALSGRVITPLPQVARTVALPAAGERRGAPVWLWAVAGLAVVVLTASGLYLLRDHDGAATPAPATAAIAQASVATEATTAIIVVAATEPPLEATATATETAEPTVATTPPESPAATATSANQLVIPQLEGADIPFVDVPAGPFVRGSTPDDPRAFDDEHPQRVIEIDGFQIALTETTNRQYTACVSDGVCRPPQAISSVTRASYYVSTEYADFPVVNVPWSDAMEFCRWAGGRLPTEAEWEKAARGTNGAIYPWGDSAPTCAQANFSNCVGDTNQVGSYADGASPYGALDMAGNVWEWVADWYSSDYYIAAPDSQPTGPSSGEGHVFRGGAWDDELGLLRAAYRDAYLDPSFDLAYVGFRCAWD